MYAMTTTRVRKHAKSEIGRHDRASPSKAPHWIEYQDKLTSDIFLHRVKFVHGIEDLKEPLRTRVSTSALRDHLFQPAAGRPTCIATASC
jgi:hypothetical protein